MSIQGHAMLAQASHDEQAEQLFVRDLKGFVSGDCERLIARAAEARDSSPGTNDAAAEALAHLGEIPGFRHWLAARRHTQTLLWDVVAACVDRQLPHLDEMAERLRGTGSVHVDPQYRTPRHLAESDVHLMPGGYDEDDGSVRQGALMDRGGAVYMLGRNGGFLNDRRGHTAAAHLLHRFPDFAPSNLLELGCGIGSSLVPMAGYFPRAQAHGVDVGRGVLDYARARAAGLGVALDLRCDDATATSYPDESFDLLFSCVVIHELAPGSIPALLAECYRLLRPGGVVLHLEVPQRYDELGLWTKIRAEIEAHYNNEPNWVAATSADYAPLLHAAGFRDVVTGYQDATDHAEPGNNGFGAQSKGVFRSWSVMSALK
ncbi:class I SAM-dependent methyltransferase [Sphingomonas sp. 35-24ZXX]|uniref:class I SAM-dependent methyltransferase n=1 Tax=Sphingomonas sp. 35-24ZXX TaxID=1545915 RepID=UPI00053BED9C|nr:class I SAM-dependent methyltransferase [Sphingomonas sp. 35-24ZXX]